MNKNNFKCKKCSYCCSYKVYPNKAELERVTNKGYNKKQFFNRFTRSIKRINGRCFFLNSKDKCCIYAIRSRVCRDFPFNGDKINYRCRQFRKDAPFIWKMHYVIHDILRGK